MDMFTNEDGEMNLPAAVALCLDDRFFPSLAFSGALCDENLDECSSSEWHENMRLDGEYFAVQRFSKRYFC